MNSDLPSAVEVWVWCKNNLDGVHPPPDMTACADVMEAVANILANRADSIDRSHPWEDER